MKNLTDDTIQKLIESAFIAAKKSYSPYSEFRVGAAVMTTDNKIFTGTNIENRSYGATICAEQVAIVKAISEGYRDLEAICVVGLDSNEILSPCGICRQIITEFIKEGTVIMVDKHRKYQLLSVEKLFPYDLLQDLKY